MIHSLISYWVARRRPEAIALLASKSKVFIDSGAFTASTLGSTIKLAQYIDWLFKVKDSVEVYANLDVIGDPKKSMRNQTIMEAEGLKPLPVFHITSDWRYLEELVERYDYLAVGGMVPFMRQSRFLDKRLDVVFKIAGSRKLHGFGVGSARLIWKYPWFSVDATTYSFANRTNNLLVYDQARRKMTQFRPTDRRRREAGFYFKRRYGIASRDTINMGHSLPRSAAVIAELVQLERAVRAARGEFAYYFGVDVGNGTIEGIIDAAKLLEST